MSVAPGSLVMFTYGLYGNPKATHHPNPLRSGADRHVLLGLLHHLPMTKVNGLNGLFPLSLRIRGLQISVTTDHPTKPPYTEAMLGLPVFLLVKLYSLILGY